MSWSMKYEISTQILKTSHRAHFAIDKCVVADFYEFLQPAAPWDNNTRIVPLRKYSKGQV
jgi:hypothetical protein